MPRTIAKPSTISEGINRRFFEAIEAIVSLGKVSALEAFCTLYDLSCRVIGKCGLLMAFLRSPATNHVTRI